MTRRVEVVAHDPMWKEDYEREAGRIAAALGPVVVAIHHIGSTAIAGIAAKPIIDMLLEIVDVGDLDRHAARLEAVGYEARGEFGIPGRRYFRKDDATRRRTHHLHAFRVESPDITRHLAFRDYMRAHPDEARTYGRLKLRLAAEHPDDMDAYMDGKDGYVKALQARALEWRASDAGRTFPAW